MQDHDPRKERDPQDAVVPVMAAAVLIVLIVALTCLGLEGKAPWQ